jgi:hypothetical protein
LRGQRSICRKPTPAPSWRRHWRPASLQPFSVRTVRLP